MGQRTLPVLRAPLYPIDRAKKPFKLARAAGSHLAREHMPTQTLPAAQNLFPHYPIYHPSLGYGAEPHD